MSEKIYYTKEEVLETISIWSKKREIEIDITPFYELGFECIYNYCKTSKGWVASFEDCCPFCVHYLIKSHGTKEDKIKFNEHSDLGKKYIIPLTRKDIALDNKRLKKKDKYNSYTGVSKKYLEKTLKKMKKNGIPTLGRGKKNLFDDVFQYMSMDDKMSSEMIYVKGLKAQCGIPCIYEKELEQTIKEEVESQNQYHGLNIQL